MAFACRFTSKFVDIKPTTSFPLQGQLWREGPRSKEHGETIEGEEGVWVFWEEWRICVVDIERA